MSYNSYMPCSDIWSGGAKRHVAVRAREHHADRVTLTCLCLKPRQLAVKLLDRIPREACFIDMIVRRNQAKKFLGFYRAGIVKIHWPEHMARTY